MVAAQYAIDFLAEPTQEELDGPTIAAVAETNPDLAAKLRSAKQQPLRRATPCTMLAPLAMLQSRVSTMRGLPLATRRSATSSHHAHP